MASFDKVLYERWVDEDGSSADYMQYKYDLAYFFTRFVPQSFSGLYVNVCILAVVCLKSVERWKKGEHFLLFEIVRAEFN